MAQKTEFPKVRKFKGLPGSPNPIFANDLYNESSLTIALKAAEKIIGRDFLIVDGFEFILGSNPNMITGGVIIKDGKVYSLTKPVQLGSNLYTYERDDTQRYTSTGEPYKAYTEYGITNIVSTDTTLLISNITLDLLDYYRAPNGVAGGDLIGSYPSPNIRTGAIVTPKIFNGAVTREKLEDGLPCAGLKLTIPIISGSSNIIPTYSTFAGDVTVSQTNTLNGDGTRRFSVTISFSPYVIIDPATIQCSLGYNSPQMGSTNYIGLYDILVPQPNQIRLTFSATDYASANAIVFLQFQRSNNF